MFERDQHPPWLQGSAAWRYATNGSLPPSLTLQPPVQLSAPLLSNDDAVEGLLRPPLLRWSATAVRRRHATNDARHATLLLPEQKATKKRQLELIRRGGEQRETKFRFKSHQDEFCFQSIRWKTIIEGDREQI